MVVLRALQRLGVDQYAEDEEHVYVARFPHAGQAIRKWYLPKEVEAHLVRKLHLDLDGYLDAIRSVEAETPREPPLPAPPAPPHSVAHASSVAACLARVRELVEEGAMGGHAVLDLRIDESVDLTAMIREAKDHRDDLHLALEQQIHPMMRQYSSLVQVTVTLPTVDPFSIGRPGYDD